MQINEYVNLWAKEKGISKKEIAETLNMMPQSYSRYSNGKIKFTAEMIKTIAEKYDVSADILLGLKELE